MKTDMIQAIKDFCLRHYENHCDVVLECYGDEDIQRAFIGNLDNLEDMLALVVECAQERLEGFLNCEAHLQEGNEYLATSSVPTKSDIRDFVKFYYEKTTA
jgi:hypothetical protein